MSQIFILQVTLALILAAPIVIRWVRTGDPDVFGAPFLVNVYLACGYLWPVDRFLEGRDTFSHAWPVHYANLEGSTAIALQIVIGASLCFQLGHLLADPTGRTPPIRRAPDAWPRSKLRIVAWLYSLGGISLFLVGVFLLGGFGVLLGGLGNRTQLFSGLNYLMMAPNLLLGVSLIWWGTALQEPKISRKVIAYIVFAVFITALLGNKSSLFVFVLCLATMWHHLRRRIATSVAIGGGLVVFSLVTFYSLVTREYLVVGEFVTVDTSSASSMYDRVGKEFDQNFMQLQTLTVLVDRMPAQLEPQGGSTYLALVAAPVPRLLWPTKPLPSTGVFTLAFWPERWLKNGTTMPPGLIGEAYLNFGGVGVLLAMFLFGFIHGRVRRRFRISPTLLNAIWFGLIFGMIPHYLRGESSSPTILILFIGVPVAMAFSLMGISGRPAKRNERMPPRAARSNEA